MLGLEYILELYNLPQQELADELGIRKQNISQWFKGGRKIPEKHIDHISKKFNITAEYFNMELKKSDELKIKLIKLRNDNPAKNITRKYESKEYGNYKYVEPVYDDSIVKEIILLKVEIERQELLESIYNIIDFSFTNEMDNLKEYVDENKTITGVFGYVITILGSKKVEPDILMEVFNAIELAYGIDEGTDSRPLVRHLQMIFCSYELDKNLHYSVERHSEVEKSYDEIDLEKLNAEDYKKVFISTDGVINFNNRGRLANSNEITEYTSLVGIVIKGVLVLKDGIFMYKKGNEDKHEYKLISKETPKLYTELLNDIDAGMEEITSCSFSNDDKVLMATTCMINKDWIYIYNYNINEKDEINKNQTMIPRTMLRANLD
ncbi:helix-turn-helix transcriptional regulator [Clostridium estertheticum]|uniref:helix-turn-helix domain-containing protein n=1 Tax=Clostridium estertheticum TaxID=238834 RepID=UPI001C6F5C48|nr:helix-turn-helix transcriptional regulator [Clostridium estertheticum]MBW9170752.1 helix-turn-helix transcriptional regulator [Clostridium estertheticum]WLC74408.1 helix-turn-helix transcriptional regulator [Clostridium estertheticum]